MSFTAIIALLQSALLLLTAAQSGTNLPQSFRDNAITVAQQAISAATAAMTSVQTTVQTSTQSNTSTTPASNSTLSATNPNATFQQINTGTAGTQVQTSSITTSAPTNTTSNTGTSSLSTNQSFTVSDYSASVSPTVQVNVSNQGLGCYNIANLPPSLSVTKMTFHVVGTDPMNDSLFNVTLSNNRTGPTTYDGSSQNPLIGGPVDEANGVVSFIQNTMTLNNGWLCLQGKIANTAKNGDTIQLSTNPAVDWIINTATPGTISTPNTVVQTKPVTISGPVLNVSLNKWQQPPSSVATGMQNVVMGYISLSVDSGKESVRVASIPFDLAGSAATSLSACQLWNGNTALNSVWNVKNQNSVYTFTFDNVVTIPPSELILTLKCNVGMNSPIGGTIAWGINQNDNNWSALGVVSSTNFTPAVQTSSGQTITISSR